VVRTKEWPVLIQEHHLGYISYQKFLENQRRIEGNAMMSSKSDRTGAGPAREGQALLQGLIRCGQCGRPMRISYGGARGSPTAKRTMQYRCWRARQLIAQEKDCQIVGGKRIDEVVIEAFLEVTREAGPAAAALAEEQLRGEGDAVARALELQLEKAEYEAQRAERQYQAVEPENRIVARELERRWNVSLTEVESLRAQAQAARERHRPLTEAEVEKARALGSDVRNIWSAPTTTDRDRKRLLRCLIEEVQLRSENKVYAVRIVWKGCAVTDREVVRHSRGNHEHATAQDTVDLVRSLVEEFDDAQVARILNRQGRRTGSGNPFTRQRVASLRAGLGLEPCAKTKARDPQEGPFTADEAAMQLGVTTTTIHRWLREGVLAGTQAAPSAPWRIVLTEEVRRRVSGGEAPRGWVGLTEAAERLGTSKPHVVYLVRTGKLKAVRTTVGKRRCWRIDVSSADSGREPGLFDQTGTGDSEEA
jgi:excisionase family DNA binding protein